MSAGQAQGRGGFAELLRSHRLASGLSQEELAERSGLAVRTIANMERGRTARPHRRSVRSLADALVLPAPQREQLDQASRVLVDGSFRLAPVLPGHSASLAPPLPAIPRQLPAVVPHFAGRADELRALTGLLDETEAACGTALITVISGTAGVGKTALAVHWAHQAAGRFPDGQLYVNLRGYDPGHPMSAADALAGFLRVLGMPGQEIPPEEDERAAQFRSLLAGRRMLIVLDNVRSVEQVRPLLPGMSGCMTVVTSRDALAGLVARDGARRLDLGLLPLADAVSLLRALIGARVLADPVAAAALAGQCCRLPLALRVAAELAAARPAVPLVHLVGDLADQQRRLNMLDAGGDPRTAVRAVFSWSCRYLDRETARAFRLVGLHPGPDLEPYAAAALTGTSLQQATQLLDQLARAYLIQPARPGHFGMHDLLRGYARELTAIQDGEEARQAALTGLFDHYLHTAAAAMDTLVPAEQHRRPLIPPASTPSPALMNYADARAWLDAERGSLVAATALGAENGWPGHAGRLAATLFRYLDSGGYFPEAIIVHGHAHRAARQSGDSAAEATALISLGVADLQQGRHGRAADRLQRALALCRETGDRVGEASALANLGVADLRQGRYERAVGHLERSLALCRGTGDRVGEAHALINLGVLYGRQGRYKQAAGHLHQALAICRETGDLAGEARVLANLGAADMRQGRHRQAAEYATRSLAIFRETGNRHSEAYVLDTLGGVELRQGRYEQAAGHHRQALELHRQIGDRSGEAHARNGLGEVLVAIGLPGDARGEHALALGLASRVGDRYEQARAHDGLARAHDAAGDPGPARRHWQQALTLYEELGVPEAARVRIQVRTAGSHVRGAS